MSPKQLKPEERLIVALDVPGVDEATRLVKSLTPLGITHYKIGLSLFTLAGPAAVEAVCACGGKVFLDLKFHDIPSTVARATRAAMQLGVWMTNLHIQGGSAMMRKSVEAVKEEASRKGGKPPLVIGVTVLTSMASKDLADLRMRKTLKDQVLYLAKLAKSAGLNGIVASAQEAQAVRWTCGDEFIIVTPGIRLEAPDPFSAAARKETSGAVTHKKDDQQRTATPSAAIQAGADYLVVGRPILEAPDSVKAAQEILQECKGSQ